MPWRLRLGAMIFVFATTLVALVVADFEPTSYGVSHLTGGNISSGPPPVDDRGASSMG